MLDRRGSDRRPECIRQDGRRRRPACALARLSRARPRRLDRPGAEAVLDHGIDAYFSICAGPIELCRSRSRQAADLLERATEQAVRDGFVAGRTSRMSIVIDE